MSKRFCLENFLPIPNCRFLGDAISILDQDHLIKGVSVVTRSADPIHDQKNRWANFTFQFSRIGLNYFELFSLRRNQAANQSDFQNTDRNQNTRTSQFQAAPAPAPVVEQNQNTPNPEIMQQVILHLINLLSDLKICIFWVIFYCIWAVLNLVSYVLK